MKIVDGLTLSAAHRAALRPGEWLSDAQGSKHRLPRFFYEIESWAAAKAYQLTAHFTLAELLIVDCREERVLFGDPPRYVPCAVTVLARYLEEFRARVEAPVFVSANGGYRSPLHRRDTEAGNRRVSPHHWATAADIYRIGDTWLDSERALQRFARIAEGLGPEVFVKPFGHGPGESDDHFHLDLGFLTLVPHGCCEM